MLHTYLCIHDIPYFFLSFSIFLVHMNFFNYCKSLKFFPMHLLKKLHLSGLTEFKPIFKGCQINFHSTNNNCIGRKIILRIYHFYSECMNLSMRLCYTVKLTFIEDKDKFWLCLQELWRFFWQLTLNSLTSRRSLKSWVFLWHSSKN